MRYSNFDLWIEEAGEGCYRVRASSDYWGQAEELLGLSPHEPDLLKQLERIRQRDADRDLLINFGSRLYGLLFTGAVGERFRCALDKVGHGQGGGIRLRLRIKPPEIAAWPWEFLYDPRQGRFLGTLSHCPVVRYVELARSIGPLDVELPLRLLVVIPSVPAPYPELDCAAEKANLVAALKDLNKRVEMDFLEGNVTDARLSDALLKRCYHGFHFIGHGDYRDDRGCLLINGVSGGAETLDEEALAELLGNHDTLKLVVLNACKGAEISSTQPLMGIAPRLIRAGVPAVVAMQFSIYDEAAVHFSREFYHSLFRGIYRGRVDYAIAHARNCLSRRMAQDRDLGAPVLYLRAPEGVLFHYSASFLEDRPYSQAWVDRQEALIETLAREPEVGEASGATQGITRVRRGIWIRNALLTTTATALLVFCLAWIKLFDVLGLDSRVEGLVAQAGKSLLQTRFSDRLLLVAIDEDSERAVGRRFDASWRKEHAQLVDVLSQAGARVIVFDLFFPRATPYDPELGAAIARARRRGTEVVLGFSALVQEQPEVAPLLARTATTVGMVCVGKRLGLVRTVPLLLVTPAGKKVYPSLTLAALAAFHGAKLHVGESSWRQWQVDLVNDHGTVTTVAFSEQTYSDTQERCPAIGPGSWVAHLYLDPSPPSILRTPRRRLRYESVLADHPLEVRRAEGSIVLVGRSVPEDTFYSSADQDTFRFGWEVHADALNTLLREVFVQPLEREAQLMILAILGLLGAILGFCYSNSRRAGLLWLLAFAVIYLGMAVVAYAVCQRLLDVLYHLTVLLAANRVATRVVRQC